MKKIFFAFMGCCMLAQPVMAHKSISNKIMEAWGGRPNWIGCSETQMLGCIGKTLREKNCKTIDAKIPAPGGYGFTFMLAREVNEHGAYFCPTTFARNGSNSTIFYEPLGNRGCVWLCLQGWTGAGCNIEATKFTGVCDVWPLLRSNYDDVKPDKAAVNIEWDFAYIRNSNRYSCTAKSGKRASFVEHDILFAIERFLDSGNGAFVQMMEFSARYDRGTKEADLQVYPAQGTQAWLACKIGYKPNAGYTDCEPINPSECSKSIMSSKMCSGWDLSAYDETIHVAEILDGCYKYKCKTAGYAFASPTDKTCIECSNNAKVGAHPIDGTCVKCDTGYVFNKTSGECVKAIGLTQIDMAYGRKKNKQSYKNVPDVKKQCWTIATPDEYKDCVLGNDDTDK